MPSIKITQLSDIGANLSPTTLIPVVDMTLTPTTDKANLQIIGNLILNGAGGANFASINIANHSSNSQIMFNDANVLSGNANLTFNKTTGTLSTTILNSSNIIKTGVFNSGTIPSAVSAGVGARAFVSDATSSTFASAYTGGGSIKVPVYSDGTGWFIG